MRCASQTVRADTLTRLRFSPVAEVTNKTSSHLTHQYRAPGAAMVLQWGQELRGGLRTTSSMTDR